jgi:hypothetical protein
MEKVKIDPDHIVELTKRLIEIHAKWVVDGVSDAEDWKNEEAGIREQQLALDEFAARQVLPEGVRIQLATAIRQFLVGGLTDDSDGPLVEDVSEDLYRAFAVRLSDAIAMGRDPRDVFASFPDVIHELCAVLDRLGAELELLAIIEHWRDTLTDAEVLSLLREYNTTGRALRRPW